MRFTTAGGSGSLAFDLQLLLVALIWGSGFSVVQISLDAGLGPMELLLGRFLVACVLMGSACRRQLKGLNRKQIYHGVTAGVILFLAFLAQTWGIRYTTPSNNAFLTSTGVVMVPFLAWGILRVRPKARHIAATLLSFAGAVVLTYTPGIGVHFNLGDLLTLLCAFLYALHIAYVGFITDEIPAGASSFLQFATSAALSALCLPLIPGGAVWPGDILSVLGPILYLGAFSTALCFFMQVHAQKRVTPSRAAVILSTESVFGSMFSVLLGLEPMRPGLLLGGGMMMGSILLMEARTRASAEDNEPAERSVAN